jgi:hypothetical protein
MTPPTDTEPDDDSATAKLLAFLRWVVERGALPLALVMAPILYQRQVADEARQSREAAERLAREEQEFRLYVELLNKREEADTQVRRGLFDRLLGSYLDPGSTNIDDRLVALEMLTLNFHDSLNLSPLFWELDRMTQSRPQADQRRLRAELDRIAHDVKQRQASVLEVDGFRQAWYVDFSYLYEGASPPTITMEAPYRGDDPARAGTTRQFTLQVLKHEPEGRRLYVSMQSRALPDGKLQYFSFWVDPYDLPLLTYSRLSADERFTVFLEDYRPDLNYANLWVLYFPSTRSGAKDRPYIDDLIARLRPTGGATAAAAPPGPGSTPAR